MKKIAFLFAGQGSQYVGMGKEFYENFEESKSVFDIANEVLNRNIADICFNGPVDLLNKTENTQPCIVTTNMAILKALNSVGVHSDISCGLSLGEYSALLNNKVIDFKDTVALVEKRGVFMQEAVKEGVGGMIAVLRLSEDIINEIINECKVYGIIECANYNSPSQIVLSGELKALDKAMELVKEKGGRAVKLPVSAPFHCSMLNPAAKKLAVELNSININSIEGIVLSNVKGSNYQKDDDVRKLLETQVESSVLFMKNIEFIKDLGVDIFVEIGPGKVLGGFVKKIFKEATILNVEDIDSFNKTIEKLKELEVIK
ncbi:MAG: ACP S-malonyltransferase [Sarcina sp.]